MTTFLPYHKIFSCIYWYLFISLTHLKIKVIRTCKRKQMSVFKYSVQVSYWINILNYVPVVSGLSLKEGNFMLQWGELRGSRSCSFFGPEVFLWKEWAPLRHIFVFEGKPVKIQTQRLLKLLEECGKCILTYAWWTYAIED